MNSSTDTSSHDIDPNDGCLTWNGSPPILAALAAVCFASWVGSGILLCMTRCQAKQVLAAARCPDTTRPSTCSVATRGRPSCQPPPVVVVIEDQSGPPGLARHRSIDPSCMTAADFDASHYDVLPQEVSQQNNFIKRYIKNALTFDLVYCP